MSNPLLDNAVLPPFSAIKAEHIKPAIEVLLADCRQAVETVVASTAEPSWQSLIEPLEETNDRLAKAWSPVSHLNSVMSNPQWRAAYESCLPLLSEFSTWVGQHQGLFAAYKKLADSPAFAVLTEAQQKAINNTLRDFHLSGVDLPAQQKARFGEIKSRLSELGSKYSNNLLDATQAWQKHVTEEAALAGLPEDAKAMLAEIAQGKGKDGWLLTLDIPVYLAVMTYAQDRALREEMYQAYCTRASDQGDPQFDNSALMDETLALRHELAQLLGFGNYAELSLATKMAESTDQVLGFLGDLARRSQAQGQADLDELKRFAAAKGCDDFQSWDQAFYAEQLKEARYAVSDEKLKPYFPETKVVPGLFAVVHKLFGIDIQERKGLDLYHPEVRFFEIHKGGQHLGSFYLDLYAREGKRGGAWMDDCRGSRHLPDGSRQKPVAYLTCNFSRPVGGKPALFTHDEVITLFHEFGHGLHHMLTRIEVAEVAGINGVPWDAVELPSQFLENWCWAPEALAIISGHVDSGEPLPQALLDNLLAARNFQSAMQMLRQLEFALFDFRLHKEFDPAQGAHIQAVLDQVRAQVAVSKPPAYNRFQHGFSHIFAGGYAAGYYSYKWAEVLSADAFGRFEEEGVFNAQTGQAFLDCILSQGGAKEPMALFKAFRGREPSVEPLLRHSGIAA
ncbi:oligopeptidase A [Gallaecimonas xiamenensis]|uniref:oligopeptidase A n=1 Tax=Gallaecimonas xiamenensis 3-C-1 TaxID=745411 RepID=K2KJB1_9GAMM|nr:oligopeptidase A [Gallaecimonas xiamenensis]EKE77400.1 oligopeptidase A [Gallaecimonas xiamenensis 3-C-1]